MNSYALCPMQPQQQVEAVRIDRVLDGDTVTLEDGRKIRLLGINTPEMAHGDKPEQPLAKLAKEQLAQVLAKQPIYLQPGRQSLDRYGRVLGHLYDVHGANVTARMLQLGAGFQVAIPPNLRHHSCYDSAEQQARDSKAGVWGHEFYNPIASTSLNIEGGYARVRGKIEKVSLSKKAIWVELEGNITLKLEKQYAENLAGPILDQVVAISRRSDKSELELEAQGWLSDRLTWQGSMPDKVKSGQKKRFQMKIQHTSAWLIP